MKQPEYIHSGRFFRTLIPPEPRRYAGQRWAKMIARSTHVVFAGIYLGALVFEIDPETRGPWFLAALLSGLAMVCLDLYESGGFLLQLRGLVTVSKLVLLACAPKFGAAVVWVTAAVAFCSVISSHATANFRYYLVWGRGRIKAAETRG
ncbi:hypothetical protein KKG45_07990 [bacterium]|nr:hypothetical protein [bacterium]MBU1073173.1 hypothetical protein [bacterium]MBU1675090.1 hypothetical protein [bacterium]